ncbi:MAG: 1-acyl-sn-glycerol-3-phosphate acyltransferase [Desulfobacteraceae bacterium]|nr:1-acyl-sn-glycerol-3-phosphate acyltransferase [Desulfobacteraceae bacterium]
MKFYRVIVWLLRVFSRLYFVEVRSLYPERIPGSGPVILAANHPASILDAILLATQTPRQIHFMANSRLFKNRFVGALLWGLGAIPVYQARETEDYGSRNLVVFRKVYELFERGGCLGLFPEGGNSPPGQMAQLRTGGARMALGAEERNNYRLGLSIVPVGMNYEHRDLFMSSALLRFGRPLYAADYAELHRNDPAEAVRRLTADLQASLRQQATHAEDEQVDELAEDLSEALGYNLAPLAPEETEPDPADTKSQSRTKRWVWKLLEWYRPDPAEISKPFEHRVRNRMQLTNILVKAAASDPASVAALRRKADRYKDHLHQAELSQAVKRSLDHPVRERLIRLRMTLYALLMAPVALFGLLHNVVPYMFTKYAARLVRQEPTRAFAYFGVGFLAFTVAYLSLGFWLWYFAGMNWKWVLFYLALLPPAGFAALHYRRNILIYREKILVRTFFWNQEELVRLLRRERREVIRHFEELEAAYRTHKPPAHSASGMET